MCRNRRKILLSLCVYLLLHVTVSASNGTESAKEEISSNYANLTTTDSGSMWGRLLEACDSSNSSCLSLILDNTLELEDDSSIGDLATFSRNGFNYTTELHKEVTSRSLKSDLTSLLESKAAKFFVTHNMRFELPEYVMDGAVVEISPRSVEKNGALFKIDVRSANDMQDVGEGRILFKKIKKFFSNKLMSAFFAIVVVIKLVKLILMFLAPVVMGATAAKQLLVKILLFAFPAISYFFKLCPFYKHTKYHHHQHHIKHIHHLPPKPHHHHGDVEHHSPSYHHPTHFDLEEEHHPSYYDEGIGYYTDGPATFDIIGHRKSDSKLNRIEDADTGWNYGQGQPVRITGKQPLAAPPIGHPDIENLLLKAEKEAMLKARLQEEQKRVQAENKLLQEQLKKALRLQDKLKFHAQVLNPLNPTRITPNFVQPMQPLGSVAILAPPPPNQIPPLLPPPNQLLLPTQQSIQIQPPGHLHVHPPSPYLQTPNVPLKSQIAALVATAAQNKLQTEAIMSTLKNGPLDPFYSPILEKIDKILTGLGVNDEGCRERLVCSMYKNPDKFSPHSNLLSAELSRDSSELQKPANNNSDVVRFYKYVQAARDGQDNRDCSRLYPMCAVNTEL